MNTLHLETILKELPIPYYVINCKTLMVVETNQQSINENELKCYKLINGFDKPCDELDDNRKCICKEVLKQKQKVEFVQNFEQQNENMICKVFASPIFDENSEITHIIAQYTDYSLEYNLKNRIKEQNAELQSQNEEYEAINDDLKENEQKLRNILENSTNVFYQHNIDHEITYISPQIENILGYTVDEAKVKWMNFSSDNPINIEGFNKTVKAIQTGEVQDPYEIEMMHKDGRRMWVEVREAPLIENGKTTAIVGALTDISEKRKAENAHKKSDELYRRLFHSSAVGIVISNMEGKVITANESVCVKLGYTYDEFVYIDFAKIYQDPNDRLRLLELIKQNGIVNNFQAKLISKNRKSIWGQFSVQLIEIDGEKRLISLISDITKQKEVELALKESGKQFKTYIESSPLPIFIINKEGQYEYANKAVSKILGYTLKDIYKMSIADVKVISETENLFDNFNELKSNGILVGRETKYKTKSGKIIDLILDAVKISENQYIAYCTDISAIKRYQIDLKEKNEEYHALNEELEENIERIQRINEELNIAKDKAEESDRLKSAFLANMSHEIRTPLNGILGFAALLHKEGIDKETYTRYVSIVENSGKRLLSVVNDIFDISLIHADQVRIEKKYFGINSLLDEVFTFYNTVKADKIENIGFNVIKSSDKEIELLNDHYRVHQIFKNLIENAFKFTSKGSVDFGYLPIEDNDITFFVKDTGIGIPIEYRDAIFNSFRQVDESITRDYDGAGLGLSICSGLIEKMGGKIWLDSEEKLGSTFYFTLPLEDLDKNTIKVTDKNIFTDRIILIADEDTQSYKFLEALLKDYNNVGIVQTSNINDAFKIMEMSYIDLVIIDVKLLGVNGKEITERIKSINTQTKIIAQKEYSSKENLQLSHNPNLNDIINKPLKEKRIIEIFEKCFK